MTARKKLYRVYYTAEVEHITEKGEKAAHNFIDRLVDLIENKMSIGYTEIKFTAHNYDPVTEELE